MTDRQIDSLFEKYMQTHSPELRNAIVDHYLYLAKIIAKKFVGRGEDFDDLVQVASMALVGAVERFSPEKKVKFVSYAAPCMIGEIKNHFRDKSRLVKLSRKDSDELIKLKTLRKEMNGGDPTAAELAEAMDVSEERVLELLEISRSSSVVSLDLETNEDGMSIRDTLGRDDDEFIKFENRDFLNKAIADLPENERMIIYYRYVRGMSQRDVAEKMGVSQMSVSRSERKILGKLREKIQAG